MINMEMITVTRYIISFYNRSAICTCLHACLLSIEATMPSIGDIYTHVYNIYNSAYELGVHMSNRRKSIASWSMTKNGGV
jgi:hypothetical protein